MQPRIERKHVSLKLAHVFVAAACVCLSALSAFASDGVSRVVLRPEVSRSHREELITRLRTITGLSRLNFDSNGSLRLGDQTTGGSVSARSLLAEALGGPNLIVLEDASSRADVAFCRVVRGRWISGEANKPPAFVVLIDFTDFHKLSGDAEARAAFDVGWGLLHEIDHVVKDSEDARDGKAVGECEDHVNRMRREVGLPIRVDYFFSRAYIKSDLNFNTRYVRLSFEREAKRYWLVWDAATVGGLLDNSQRALVR
jgi:hypothetical protein